MPTPGTVLLIGCLMGLLVLLFGLLLWKASRIERHTGDTVKELERHRRVAETLTGKDANAAKKKEQ